ncbi:hypothetical protein [uncultured Kordia sp.]|uniref:hypothetical protein n=1 Tax=uncultured Kordia sp. TaxID=507699 RepID=UPI002638A473|nr:hypothetical protein [uncultured Kordia sp.]
MKPFLYIFLIIFVVSCSNSDDVDQMEDTIAKDFTVEKFTGNKIAYKYNDNVSLGVPKTKLITSFNNFSRELGLDKKALSVEILEVEKEYYIRFYNEDKSVSTVALLPVENSKNDQHIFSIGKTTCHSTACSNCCGCLPKGDYCTKCEVDYKDCERTTTSGE